MGLRKAISSYLITLPVAFIKPAKDVPPITVLTELERKGIPIVRGTHV
ncbi:MAG: hypothetical protein JJE09_08835 [Bacteroidia bacterium]|nr:hypothetical protein [Bacteroidia bacterium]